MDEAAACWRRALELNPNHVDALNNLGNVLRERGQLDQAVVCYRRALELNPDSPTTYYNFGTALSDQGLLADAMACYRRALALKPDYPDALNNLGFALKRQQALDEAAACYRRALELKPDFAECRLNLAVLQLLRGDFAQGWPGYESRWPAGKVAARHFRQPLWDGRPLEGRTVLLHAEQGFGDTLQFIRYAPLVKQRGARVIVECQEPLVRLLAAWPQLEQVVPQGEPLPPFDVHVPLLSLPGIFHTSLEEIPAQTPYFSVPPNLIEHWRGALSDCPKTPCGAGVPPARAAGTAGPQGGARAAGTAGPQGGAAQPGRLDHKEAPAQPGRLHHKDADSRSASSGTGIRGKRTTLPDPSR